MVYQLIRGTSDLCNNSDRNRNKHTKLSQTHIKAKGSETLRHKGESCPSGGNVLFLHRIDDPDSQSRNITCCMLRVGDTCSRCEVLQHLPAAQGASTCPLCTDMSAQTCSHTPSLLQAMLSWWVDTVPAWSGKDAYADAGLPCARD
eukprot:6049321-Amphidinium_carterae.1